MLKHNVYFLHILHALMYDCLWIIKCSSPGDKLTTQASAATQSQPEDLLPTQHPTQSLATTAVSTPITTSEPQATTQAPTAAPKPATQAPTAAPKPTTQAPTKPTTQAPSAAPKPTTQAPTAAPNLPVVNATEQIDRFYRCPRSLAVNLEASITCHKTKWSPKFSNVSVPVTTCTTLQKYGCFEYQRWVL